MNDHYLNPSGVSKFWDKTKQLIESSGSSGITNIPAGGITGQILTKKTDSDYDMEWLNPPLITISNQSITSYHQLPPGMYHLANCTIAGQMNVSNALASVSISTTDNTIDKLHINFLNGMELVCSVGSTYDLTFESLKPFADRVNELIDSAITEAIEGEY